MSREKGIGEMISGLARFFAPHCPETSTLREVEQMAGTVKHWQNAHELFDRIREKRLLADSCQYAFEEICAKTMYNLADPQPDDPFDDDSAFFVFPLAIAFAQSIGIYEELCTSPAMHLTVEQ